MYEVSIYLFGASIALLVAIATWSNKIKGPRKDLRDLKEKFCTKFGIKNEDIIPIVKKGKVGKTEGFFKEIYSLSKVLISSKLKKKDDVLLLRKIKTSDEKIEILKKDYSRRYSSFIFLTILFFVCGLILFILPPEGKISISYIEINYDILLSLPSVIFFIYILIDISKTKRKEDELEDLMEEILDEV